MSCKWCIIASMMNGGRPTNPAAPSDQVAGLPEGHPPVDGPSGAETQRLRQQVSEIQGLLASNPNDAGLMAAMGNVYFDAGRWTEARDWYEKSLQVTGDNSDVLTDLAVVYRNLDQPQRAIELLDRAIALDSNHWQAGNTSKNSVRYRTLQGMRNRRRTTWSSVPRSSD